MIIYASSTMPVDVSPILPKRHAERIQILKQTSHETPLPIMLRRSVHLLLLVDAEGARTHVDQQKKPAPVGL